MDGGGGGRKKEEKKVQVNYSQHDNESLSGKDDMKLMLSAVLLKDKCFQSVA